MNTKIIILLLSSILSMHQSHAYTWTVKNDTNETHTIIFKQSGITSLCYRDEEPKKVKPGETVKFDTWKACCMKWAKVDKIYSEKYIGHAGYSVCGSRDLKISKNGKHYKLVRI
jgi:hypothetical protein